VLNPEAEFQFTEGPVADTQGNVYFTDVRANRIYRRNVDGQLSVVLDDSGGANGLAIDTAGQLVICQGELGRVARLDKNGSLSVLADEYDGKRFNKPNDLWMAPNGGVYFSDPLVMLDSAGRRVRTFPTPEQPTNVCLIEGESKLFVTARSRILLVPLRGARKETSGERRAAGGGDTDRKPWLVVHAAEMDSNADGFLHRSELEKACRDVFAMYDRNSDRMLAVDEYAGSRGEARHAMGGFVKQHSGEIDANTDGQITLDELLSLAGRLFDKSDRERAGRIIADPAIAPSNNPVYAPPPQRNR
jgi:hypothetical protein